MQAKRIAVIDLGTNTFNLLVAEWTGERKPKILHRSKYPTKIGKGGITKHKITEKAILRARHAFEEITCITKEFEVSQYLAYATSAIRSAENGAEFVQIIEQEFHIEVDIISGDREAELIYTGTRNALELNHEPIAILDIGGGSNEIIIANNEKIFWEKSYPLGMTRLLEQFVPSDPILKTELLSIEAYLKEQLYDLFDALELHNVKTLIGSSGSFDTLKQILIAGGQPLNGSPDTQFEIKLKDFFRLHQNFLASTLEERKAMPGMDPVRVELMVIASIFIHYLVKDAGFSKLYQSSFALKEGALFDYIEQHINTDTQNNSIEVKK
ncbi:Ppx/GppA phosphatase family protein [Ancylomarina longa]|uniref:Phosphatase n=1 Tax=Ancylomarina longa TaxID=2487017 RepID=A0A434AY01_9BACT|nr:phosphatase [Ancylomarina longa]RUT79432.1 phosphatase [Ancylomarina longa]